MEKLAVLIPDRKDRPQLLANCLRMIDAQTLKPDKILVLDDDSGLSGVDLTWRYRTGYDKLRDYDLIAFMENDDWYSPDYLKFMVSRWRKHGKPELFGTAKTIYYHIFERAWFTMIHPARSSAMNTLIKGGLKFNWCPDHEVYTDIHLWMHTNLEKVIIEPEKVYSIGIKHGIGKCGGKNHTTHMYRYINKDNDFIFLRACLDKPSFEFYTSLQK